MKLNIRIEIIGLFSFCWFAFPFYLKAYSTVRETVKTVDSINIDIEVMMPDRNGTFPVLFFVHGGGWDHGTSKVTPGPQHLSSASILCDALGVVFIGVDYRCKNQNGNFRKAMEDVMDVYKYAEKNAKRFRCDFKQVGFAGASAGTPLSAIVAQEIAVCKLYIGIYGKYNFVSSVSGGYWPSAETAQKFGVATDSEKKQASVVTRIRKNPPATLLIHGDADPTTGYLQSIEFADSIRQKGGFVRTVILPGVKHGFYKPEGGKAFVDSSFEIMEHLIRFFNIKNADTTFVAGKLK